MARGRTRRPRSNRAAVSQAATTGYEAELWRMADALRGSIDAEEYKHVVLGLIFLKYISEAFEERHAQLEPEQAEGADPEDPDEYRALSIFWVPREACWGHLKAQARQPPIGQLVDDAIASTERDSPALKYVLPKENASSALDIQRLGELIDMISNIRMDDEDARSKDVLGRVYDPCCGSSGASHRPGARRGHGRNSGSFSGVFVQSVAAGRAETFVQFSRVPNGIHR